ncbi:hypothetical protein A4A49_40529 [Nicotiana attenuata]|uniref:Late embryogenesis abundant protein LEA-2 subgroup domain-containing protein n=1 Tax=Nicotiana attenuata TaxID=49451 RepID=A0A1J6KAC7_NICAT|nr:hypothetical protein A4A49_40529 [Nicotiana attenuata]
MEKSVTFFTTTIDSTQWKNQVEKSDTKGTTTIDSTKINSKCNIALQILLLGLAVMLGITLAFHMFYIHEGTTVIHNPKIEIVSVSPSSFTVSTLYINPLIVQNPDSWNLAFSIQNPNSNYNFYYYDLEASISYNDTLLWSAKVLDKFYQDGKAQTSIDSTFAAMPEPYVYWIAKSISDDLASGQTTRFSVSLNGKIQISNHIAPSHISCRKLEVYCEGLQVEYIEDARVGVLGVDSKACEVNIFQDSRC